MLSLDFYFKFHRFFLACKEEIWPEGPQIFRYSPFQSPMVAINFLNGALRFAQYVQYLPCERNAVGITLKVR